MSIYAADNHSWSGLLSKNKYDWQEGLRNVCRNVGDFQFHPSSSGYAGWRAVARHAIDHKKKFLLLMGHSNGGYAITKCAEFVAPHGIKCALICWDRTLKRCPPIGHNVVAAIDLYAGLRTLEQGPDFRGYYKKYDFTKETHTGILKNLEAQRIATEFGLKWKNHV